MCLLIVSIFLSKFLQWRSQPYPILAQLRRSFLRFFSELWSILSKNIKLTVNIGHFEGQRETGSVLTCTEQHYEIVLETLYFHWLLRSWAGNSGKIRPAKQSYRAIRHNIDPASPGQHLFPSPNWRWQINDSYTK